MDKWQVSHLPLVLCAQICRKAEEDESMKDTTQVSPIRDARKLGVPKMLILGLQHMFAMFGATIVVPLITGLDVSTTLLFAGLGTLLFHVLSKGKVPAFLGSDRKSVV